MRKPIDKLIYKLDRLFLLFSQNPELVKLRIHGGHWIHFCDESGHQLTEQQVSRLKGRDKEAAHLYAGCLRLANEVLITSEGRPNYESFAILRKQGLEVSPGEVDSFGWLSGIITSSKNPGGYKLAFG